MGWGTSQLPMSIGFKSIFSTVPDLKSTNAFKQAYSVGSILMAPRRLRLSCNSFSWAANNLQRSDWSASVNPLAISKYSENKTGLCKLSQEKTAFMVKLNCSCTNKADISYWFLKYNNRLNANLQVSFAFRKQWKYFQIVVWHKILTGTVGLNLDLQIAFIIHE